MTRKTTGRAPPTEFSFVVRPADVGPEPAVYALEATEAERATLATRFDLVALDALTADLRLEWLSGHHFLRLSGRIRAQVTQRCVVTLQPVPNTIDEPFEILFSPGSGSTDDTLVNLDDVEPLTGEQIDIAEIAAEELALMLDPYPRADGASLGQAAFGPGSTEAGARNDTTSGAGGTNRPFEVLATLKRNQ